MTYTPQKVHDIVEKLLHFEDVKPSMKGNLISLKGKRIYTLEEANLVAKPTGNTIRIKYR